MLDLAPAAALAPLLSCSIVNASADTAQANAKRINAHIAATAATSDVLESGEPNSCECQLATEVEFGGEEDESGRCRFSNGTGHAGTRG